MCQVGVTCRAPLASAAAAVSFPARESTAAVQLLAYIHPFIIPINGSLLQKPNKESFGHMTNKSRVKVVYAKWKRVVLSVEKKR